jgi:hypothetical protein
MNFVVCILWVVRQVLSKFDIRCFICFCLDHTLFTHARDVAEMAGRLVLRKDVFTCLEVRRPGREADHAPHLAHAAVLHLRSTFSWLGHWLSRYVFPHGVVLSWAQRQLFLLYIKSFVLYNIFIKLIDFKSHCYDTLKSWFSGFWCRLVWFFWY